jgi:4-hydroxymandelate oxidase
MNRRGKSRDPVSLQDFEASARKRMAPGIYDFIAGGAADEITIRWNREAYDRLRLRPRVLVDVSRVDTRVKLLGLDLPHPILLAPVAYQRLVHRQGELAAARGAGASESVFVVSSSATVPVEEIARVATSPLWFQLYVQPDAGMNREILQRAQAAGCRAVCVTVDTPVLGPRNREQRNGFALPRGFTVPMNPQNLQVRRAAATPASSRRMPVTWKDIDAFQSMCSMPVLLKGILHPEDADRAARAGVAGIIVSNHGGRNLDTAPATIEALPEIAERVAGRIPVLVDGGIRRGTDVVKALGAGASAVLIGRPYVYGLSLGGAAGVARVVQILRTELEMAMALVGRPRIADLDRSLAW